MVVLGKPGNQPVTLGQIIAASIGSLVTVLSFYLWYPYITHNVGFVCQKYHIKTFWQYISVMLSQLFGFNSAFFVLFIAWAYFTILVIRVIAMAGEDDKVII